MILKRSIICGILPLRYLLAGIIGVILYSEWFVYKIQSFDWPQMKCEQDDPTCAKILFVADPQIQGDEAVRFPLNKLFNWDSDRYLKSTFSKVIHHFRPDMIVYLGDLMDEGSISTKVQFHQYVKRLFNIFDMDYSVTQLWIPGDNDIGGENEPIRKDKIEEFNNVFIRPKIVSFKDIAFLDVSGITHRMLQITNEELEHYKLRIVVSHYDVASLRINEKLHPHIYFCAHSHESKYNKYTTDMRRRMENRDNLGEKPLEITFSNDMLYEIFVPTCSYRMGTQNIGYGAAVVENNYQQLRYAVLWSPRRFVYLYVYLFLIVIVVIYCLLCLLRKCISLSHGTNYVRLPTKNTV